MKKWIALIICLITLSVFGQENILNKYEITEIFCNKKKLSGVCKENGTCLVFYSTKDSAVAMANVWQKDGSCSFGKIYNVQDRIVKTLSGAKKKIFTFLWKYENTYDDKKGALDVIFTVIKKSKEAFFTLKMTLENNVVYILKGVEVAPQMEY